MARPDREDLGKAVRALWVAYAAARPDPKPHHLLPWDDLDEENKEVDRIIGGALYEWGWRDGWNDARVPTPEALDGVTYYLLPDGRRLTVISLISGRGGMYMERPWKRSPLRYTRDKTTPYQVVESTALAHRFAREMGGMLMTPDQVSV